MFCKQLEAISKMCSSCRMSRNIGSETSQITVLQTGDFSPDLIGVEMTLSLF